MDYFRILNLNKEPFSNSPDPEFFFHSRQHLDCLQKLELSLLLRRGLNVIIGDVGTGKTTLCRQLIRRFSQKEEIETHLILDPHVLNATEFLASVTEMFTGEKPPVGSNEWPVKEQIKQYLFRKGVHENKTVVLIIDEGQKIPAFCLEILREFLNYETNEYKLLQIVIFAQKEFEGTVRKYPNFADRINLYHRLKPLNFRDTRSMIKYRLEQSSKSLKNLNLFTMPALWAIYRITGGYPRKIINLCHHSILSMIIRNRSKSGYLLVSTCARRAFPEESNRKRRVHAAAMAVGTVAVALLIFLPSDRFKTMQWKVSKAPVAATVVKKSEDALAEKTRETTYATILGQITLKRNETLSRIIMGIYGGFNLKYFKSLIIANPDIEDPDRVEVGQIISLPAIPARVRPLNTPVWWLKIDDRDSLEAAFNLLRNHPDGSPGVRLIPYWNPSDGTRFAVVLDKLFKDEITARNHLQQLPAELAFNSTILSRWEEETVYFSNPYFN